WLPFLARILTISVLGYFGQAALGFMRFTGIQLMTFWLLKDLLRRASPLSESPVSTYFFLALAGGAPLNAEQLLGGLPFAVFAKGGLRSHAKLLRTFCP
ncbi:MAG TPA: hypothetical protein VN982_11360, partial [Candidatus Dormibacteraeota bacterium]|nr:hypothetical protein [Candidatus Dormibacteraeota bacterium]